MMVVDNQGVNATAMEEALKQIKVTKTTHSRIAEVDFNNLVFGKKYADHMLVADFDGKEWHDAQHCPDQEVR